MNSKTLEQYIWFSIVMVSLVMSIFCGYYATYIVPDTILAVGIGMLFFVFYIGVAMVCMYVADLSVNLISSIVDMFKTKRLPKSEQHPLSIVKGAQRYRRGRWEKIAIGE